MWKIVQMFPGKAEMEIKKELMNTSLLGTVLPWKKKIFVCCKNETYLPGANFLKNSTLDVVHKLRKEGREGFREVLCKNTP